MRKLIFFTLFITILLALRFFFYYSDPNLVPTDKEVTFSSRIVSIPEPSGKFQVFRVLYDGNTKITVRTGIIPPYFYGDLVEISGTIKKRVLQNKQPVFSTSFPQIRAISYTKQSLFYSSLFGVRESVRQFFKKTLPQAESSLMLGIVFGIKESFSKDIQSSLQVTGLLHIIAASGMNVSLVAAFFMQIFSQLFSRKTSLFLTICGVILYSLLAGLEPSILRASIMGIIVFTANFFGRQSYAVWALLLTGGGMLLWRPTLITDVGFQLSFAATSGIIFLQPMFEGFRVWGVGDKVHKISSFFVADAMTTTAAQLATIPIMLGTFGSYGLFSIIINALLLWMIPPLMVLGGIAALLQFVFPPLATILLYLCEPLLFLFLWIVDFFGKLSPVLTVPDYPWEWNVGYYFLLCAFVVYLQKKRKVSM